MGQYYGVWISKRYVYSVYLNENVSIEHLYRALSVCCNIIHELVVLFSNSFKWGKKKKENHSNRKVRILGQILNNME